jgi:hypothetical protein
MLSCVSITPLGYDVVPDVNCISSTSPGVTSSKDGASQVSPSATMSRKRSAAFGTSLPSTTTFSSRGSAASGSAVSMPGQISRSIAMKSILRKRSTTNRSFTSACFRQYASSSALKRVFTGTVTAPTVAAA